MSPFCYFYCIPTLSWSFLALLAFGICFISLGYTHNSWCTFSRKPILAKTYVMWKVLLINNLMINNYKNNLSLCGLLSVTFGWMLHINRLYLASQPFCEDTLFLSSYYQWGHWTSEINNLSNDISGSAQTYIQVFTVRFLQLPQKFVFAFINMFCLIVLPL